MYSFNSAQTALQHLPASCTRRAALVASGAALYGCSRRRRQNAASPVMIVRAADYDQTLFDTIRRIFAEHKVDVRGRSVLLKPNLVEFDAGHVINTHALLVLAVFEACRSAGAASVRIAEGPGHRRTTLDLADSAGYFSTIASFERVFTDLNLDEVEYVGFANPRSKLKSLYFPKSALQADLIISLPKMKTHHWTGATLSMKNLFGLVPGAVYGWPKNVLHWAGINESIVDIHSAFRRYFAIVDGIEGMEGNGPIQGTAKHAGVIVSGSDLAAVDATCCRIMGINPDRIGYLQMAGANGHTEASGIPQIGERIGSVRTPFRIIPQLQHIADVAVSTGADSKTGTMASMVGAATVPRSRFVPQLPSPVLQTASDPQVRTDT